MRVVEREGRSFLVRDDPSNGWDGFWGLWESGDWEPRSFDVIERFVPGKVFVDVGAWIGPLTLWAAALADSVVAIEPDPVAVEALRDTLEANRLDNVEVREVAIVAESGPGHLVPVDRGQFGDSMSRLSGVGTAVATTTLPDLLQTCGVQPHHVGLVKIDVEGYETTLLPALGPWLAEHRIPFQLAVHGVRPEMDSMSKTHRLDDSWLHEEWGEIVGESL